jgi:hypothetical protein
LALFLRFAGSERSQDALLYASIARALRPSDRQVIRELADLKEMLGNDAEAALLRELYDEKQFDYEQDPERKRWLQAFNEIPRSDHEARALSARERLSVDGDDRQAQRELVESLTELGRYDEVLALADSLGAASDRGDDDPLADVRRRAALERGLDGLDDGDDLARDELWLRAEVCRQTDRFARAAELYARLLDAPEEERGERNGRRTWNGRSRGWDVRYHAATAAGLAGLGLGRDALGTTPEWRSAQRERSLEWARAELEDARNASAERSRGGSRNPARWIAQRWLDDVRLAPLRDPVRLADLPAEERAAWNELWLGFQELASS